ncbi:MAG TPA: glucose-6-phosphate dehydrogenase [Anaerolineales bacterium]|nr:glucose-6-phosphate dehydrogenase [Anaerolineales bacterium]
MEPVSHPTTLVIFGASGDLTQRKLIPALFSLYQKGMLPQKTRIVGFARRPWDHDKFRGVLLKGMQQFAPKLFDAQAWETFAGQIFYSRGNLDSREDYDHLQTFLNELEGKPANRLFYCATSPEFFPLIVEQLGQRDMQKEEDEQWVHIVIEKPFGHDLASALELNHKVQSVFQEDQVYRIDHYLGKETVQNLLTFRFANTIFEPLWNRNYVDHVQITNAETVDVGYRAGYYEESGVVRDMFQNHLLQLVALTAMEPPATFNAKALRDETVKVLHAISPINMKDTVWGQYRKYRDAEGVAPRSRTPTFIAIKLFVDNWRWQGVPFYIRSGKALTAKTTEITLAFKQVPHLLFPDNTSPHPNRLSICIQPDEGIHLTFETKIPGGGMRSKSVDMDFHYNDIGEHVLPDAYERLLLDALKGDASLFTRSDGIERAWQLVDPILQAWERKESPPLCFYESGTWGPSEADELTSCDDRSWVLGCGE